MKLNKRELKKVMFEFNSISNRLLKANYEEYTLTLMKFINFIKDCELIYSYIQECGEIDFDLCEEFEEVSKSCGRAIFSLGETEEEEVRNIYAILCFIAINDISVRSYFAMGYSESNKFQDMIRGFNERVAFVLIDNINKYLTKIGIDMGLDEKIKYEISHIKGQVNVASDDAVINAVQNNGLNGDELRSLLDKITNETFGLDKKKQNEIADRIEVIESELTHEKPRKSMIRTALDFLKGVKNTADFAVAVTNLSEYVQRFL